MYSESIETPHFRKTHHGPGQSLVDAAEITDISELVRTADALQTDLIDDIRIDAALQISQQVGRSLWFPEKGPSGNDFEDLGIPFPIPLDTLTEKQTTNCYGYTILTSECLEAAGIPHYVGFTNDHAAIMLPQGNGFYYLDSLYPRLNQELGNAVRRGGQVSVNQDIELYGRGAIMVDTEAMAINIGTTLSSMPLSVRSWMVHSNSGALSVSAGEMGGSTASLPSGSSRLVMSLYEPATGRHVLEQYVTLDCALNGEQQDITKAISALNSIIAIYPNIDARQRHDEVRRLCTHIAARDPEQAATIAEKYFDESFAITQDTRVAMAKADILRLIARVGRSGPIARLAIQTYEEVMTHPRAYKSTLLGKHSKAVGLLNQIMSRPN